MKTPILVFFTDNSVVLLGSWIHERKKTFFLALGSLQVDWEFWVNRFFLAFTQPLRCPLSPGGRGIFVGTWILRLRLRLRAEWQGGKYTAKSENSRNRENNHIEKPNIPTKKGFVVMCIEFWLILGTSFFDWYMCWVLNKSGSNCAVCRCFV